ncbi:MAG TPA: M56 family metallopeptidase [Candidatus Baltobacteraceae bacterium]|jgi:beta-lactamase regulating signal transducer with metallopeptidase domain|nr:M56 family metallopeptidase [Candidatus Baltobacteraceae bacterium]
MTSSQVLNLATGALGAGLIAGLIAIASTCGTIRALRLQHSANARFTLWIASLIAVSLAVPAFFAGGYHALVQTPAVALDAQSHSVPVALRQHVEIHAGIVAVPAHVTPPVDAAGLNYAAIALCVWLAGAAFSVLRIVLGVLKLRQVRMRARLVGVRSTPRGDVAVLNADAFSVPVALGYRKPAIVLPSSVLRLDGTADVEQVVLHELEHLRRFDDVTSLLQSVCVCVFWFNPFLRYIAHRAAIEREMACDEAVVARTGKRVRYATTLWKVATSTPDSPLPALLSAFFSGHHTVARMNNLLSAREQRPARVPAGAFALATCALFLACAIAAPAFVGAPAIHNYAAVDLRGGDRLAIGGERAGSAVGSAQLLDRSGRIIALIPMHVARWSSSATLLPNGNVLVLGGMTDHGATNQAELYDAKSRSFCVLPPLRSARAGHSATLLPNGRILVASGERVPGKYVATTEIYDPRTGRSTITADGAGRVFATALLIDNGSVLLFGGGMSRGHMRCAIIYDPARRGYRDAGEFVSFHSNAVTFKLPNGAIVTHRISGT